MAGVPKVNMPVDAFGAGWVAPVSVVSDWTTAQTGLGSAWTPIAITPGGSFAAPGSVTVLHRVEGRGTNLRVRVRYSGSVSAVGTQPKYRVMGRKRPPGSVMTDLPGDNGDLKTTAYEWQILPNRNGDIDCLATCSPASDILLGDGGSGQYASVCDYLVNTHDCDGCNDFIIVCTVAMAQTGGSNTTSLIEAKII